VKQPEYQAGNKPRASHRRASRRPALSARLSSCRWLAWSLPVSWAIRACGDAFGAGWHVRQGDRF